MNITFVIELPQDRNRMGKIYALNSDRQRVMGPYAIAAKADGITATHYNNRDRNPLRPYGDFPLGQYQITNFYPSNFGIESYGNNGILMLTPVHGDGVTAQHNGRQIFMIHAGGLEERGVLQPTNGSLRVSAPTMRQLTSVITQIGFGIRCEVIASQPMMTMERIGRDTGLETGDPAQPPQVKAAPTAAQPSTHPTRSSNRLRLQNQNEFDDDLVLESEFFPVYENDSIYIETDPGVQPETPSDLDSFDNCNQFTEDLQQPENPSANELCFSDEFDSSLGSETEDSSMY
ncbi:hypothetical protein ACQ4M3_07410 [Leptolyngbya sp. AN03gr2]|uniref:hypothetical protein n=1 Tax=unclassified Leptolyngbya TaxID=2650499 RepID=UPI003D31AB20